MANTTITEGMVADIARNYLVAALWTAHAWYPEGHAEHDGNPAQLDDIIDVDDLDVSVVASAVDAVRVFLGSVTPDDLTAYFARHDHYQDDAAAQMGHDLLLTRNGHGAGFWDRGMGDLGDRLSDVARAMGEHELHAYLTVTADPDDLTEDDLDGPVTFDH